MNEVEMEHRLTVVEKLAGSNKHRIDDLEADTKTLQELSTSCKVMAEQLAAMNKRLDKVDAAVKSDVEGKIAALRKAMEGDDAAAIKAATEELAKASHKLAEQLYQQQAPNGGAQQQPGAGANPGAGAAQGNNNDDVVDADFTEVKK